MGAFSFFRSLLIFVCKKIEHIENLNSIEKINQKIKLLTSGGKYGLNPDGIDYEELIRKLKLNKKIYKIITPFTILIAGISLFLLFANIYDFAPLNYNAVHLLLLISISLIVNNFRLKAYIQKLEIALFLYEIKSEIPRHDELAV